VKHLVVVAVLVVCLGTAGVGGSAEAAPGGCPARTYQPTVGITVCVTRCHYPTGTRTIPIWDIWNDGSLRRAGFCPKALMSRS
jgi:hypothetical protein